MLYEEWMKLIAWLNNAVIMMNSNSFSTTDLSNQFAAAARKLCRDTKSQMGVALLQAWTSRCGANRDEL
jgi:hypothetical protein